MITHVFAGLAVRDGTASWEWYERLFGRPADMRPHEREAVWRLSDAASVYVVEDGGRAGSGAVTVAVDDLEAWAAGLLARGIAARRDEASGRPPSLVAADPDGNTVTFFADPGAQR